MLGKSNTDEQEIKFLKVISHVSELNCKNARENIPTIQKLKNNYRDDLIETIASLITMTSLSLNIKTSLSQFQAFEIIQSIIKDYNYLTCDEVALAFYNGKTGSYGSHYNKLDIETIHNWLRSYSSCDERLDYLENRHKTNSKTFEVHPTIINAFKKIRQEINEEEKSKNKIKLEEKELKRKQQREVFLKNIVYKVENADSDLLLHSRSFFLNDTQALEIFDKEIKKRKLDGIIQSIS